MSAMVFPQEIHLLMCDNSNTRTHTASGSVCVSRGMKSFSSFSQATGSVPQNDKFERKIIKI